MTLEKCGHGFGVLVNEAGAADDHGRDKLTAVPEVGFVLENVSTSFDVRGNPRLGNPRTVDFPCRECGKSIRV
ncbi:unannotated protein [freshwater metagenome]|uniref:Unannotated protein n=1 Tax=freshwater metagenome TaxID=449393 RepID=A0A6J6BHV4_9ZZZZ